MNTAILERLRGFQIPGPLRVPQDHHFVARLTGIDFEGLLSSPELGLSKPFDATFAKLMVHTVSHLLGGDACGRFGYVEQTELSVLFDRQALPQRWEDATRFQNYLVGLASTKLSALVEAESLFGCQLFAFPSADIVVSYFVWRQQETDAAALDAYCTHVLGKDTGRDEVAKLLDGLGPREKEEILSQNNIAFGEVPGWQRWGTAVYLDPSRGTTVDANLPRDVEYANYIKRHIDS